MGVDIMEKKILILGLQKACVVLHSLAFTFKDEKVKNDTLMLVNCLVAAIDELQKRMP